MTDDAKPPEGAQPDDQEPVRALVAHIMAETRAMFTAEVMPQINRHTDEVIEAVRNDIAVKLANMTAPSVDVASIAREAGKLLTPEIQGVVNQLSSRIANIETAMGGRAAQPPAGQPPTANGAVPSGAAPPGQPQQPGTSLTVMPSVGPTPVSGAASGTPGSAILAIGDGLVALAKELLPLYVQWKGAQAGSVNNIAWATALRATDPVQATILAQTLNPDPMAAYMPMMLADAIKKGMQAKVMAGQGMPTVGMPGGPGWPSIPSSPPSTPSSNMPVNASPPPSGQTPTPSGASMNAPGVKPLWNGQRQEASAPGSRMPRSLTELLGMAGE